MRKRSRAIFAGTLIAVVAPLAGCQWWLSFETGGLTLAEMILQRFGTNIQNNEIVPNSASQGGAGGALSGGGAISGGGSLSGGGGSGGGSISRSAASAPPQDADLARPAPAPISMSLAGRQWRIVEARAAVEPETPSAPPIVTPLIAPPAVGPSAMIVAPSAALAASGPPRPASRFVALEIIAESGGLPAILRLRIPAPDWPTDGAGAPLSLTYDGSMSASANARAGASAKKAAGSSRPAPNEALRAALGVPAPVTLPLSWPVGEARIELAGRPFSASVERCALAQASPDPANPGASMSAAPLPIRGHLDAIVSRQDGPATRQLLRIRFAPEAAQATGR